MIRVSAFTLLGLVICAALDGCVSRDVLIPLRDGYCLSGYGGNHCVALIYASQRDPRSYSDWIAVHAIAKSDAYVLINPNTHEMRGYASLEHFSTGSVELAARPQFHNGTVLNCVDRWIQLDAKIVGSCADGYFVLDAAANQLFGPGAMADVSAAAGTPQVPLASMHASTSWLRRERPTGLLLSYVAMLAASVACGVASSRRARRVIV